MSAARSTSRSRHLVFNSPFRHLAARVAVSGAKASQRSSTLAISSLACPLAGRLLLCTQPAEQAVFSLSLKGDQPLGIGGVDDEDGEQTGRFCGARVLADGMIRVGRLRPALAGAKHLRLAVIHLASDRAREYVAGDEGGTWVVMRLRCATGRIVDDKADKALAGNVRYRLLEGRRGCLTLLRSRLG